MNLAYVNTQLSEAVKGEVIEMDLAYLEHYARTAGDDLLAAAAHAALEVIKVGELVDDIFVEEDENGRLCLYVTLNKGNVGQGAITEVIPLGDAFPAGLYVVFVFTDPLRYKFDRISPELWPRYDHETGEIRSELLPEELVKEEIPEGIVYRVLGTHRPEVYFIDTRHGFLGEDVESTREVIDLIVRFMTAELPEERYLRMKKRLHETFPLVKLDDGPEAKETAEEPSGSFKVKPALYKFPGLAWAWVNLGELAETVSMEPGEVFTMYFALSKDIDLMGVADEGGNFENVDILGRIAYSGEYFLGSMAEFVLATEEGRIFIPAGWAMDVIAAAEAGVVRVVEQFHEHLDNLDECPPGTLNCVFTGTGFVAAVGLDADGNPVETGYGQAPRHERGCCRGCLDAGRILEGHIKCSFPSQEAQAALEADQASLRLTNRRGWRVVWEG